MRVFRRFLVLGFAVAAFSALVPSVSASTPIGQLLLTKTCDTFVHCTVITSTSGPLPVGTEGFYPGPYPSPRLSSRVILVLPGDAGTATGHCTLSYKTGTGTCSFGDGTGDLAGVHINLTVTTPDFETFTWSGTYHFDRS